MAKNVSVISIRSTIQKTWDALTKPELVKRWQFGSDLITDWNIGSEIRFRTEWEGTVFEQWGKILDVRPLELIRYSLFAPRPGLEDKPENNFIMSYQLANENGRTKLVITQDDIRPGAIQEETKGEENAVLQSLKQLIENN